MNRTTLQRRALQEAFEHAAETLREANDAPDVYGHAENADAVAALTFQAVVKAFVALATKS